MKKFNTIGREELSAATRVLKSNVLSGYIGSSPFGGPEVCNLAARWGDAFYTENVVPCNSATAGILAACMAVGVEPGDEVVVSPYTMSATAAAPAILGAKILWADIEPDYYTVDPLEVSNLITNKTKAVIATNLFGHPAYLREIYDICQATGCYLIEDNAQAIFAEEDGQYAGTIGHIGVFSLNVHKHLQTGEGGIVVTNDAGLYERLNEAINHGEMRDGILGLNLRMTELTAAIAVEQLKKAEAIMWGRIEIAEELTINAVKMGLPLDVPRTRQGCTHSYYIWGAQTQSNKPLGPLPPIFRRGYLRPLYTLKAFSGRIRHLPTVEDVESRMLMAEVCSFDASKAEIKAAMEELAKCL